MAEATVTLPRDEAGELRAALIAAKWERLTDALLPFVLLSDPGEWWPRAARWCAQRLSAPLHSATSLRGWTVDQARQVVELLAGHPFMEPSRLCACIRRALAIAPPGVLSEDRLAALAVLERFAPP